MSRHYTKTLTLPTSKQDGLANFVQMIVNRLETATEETTIESMRAQVGEAVLIAVDLWNDVHCGNYNSVIAAATSDASIKDQHIAELASTFEAGRIQGKQEVTATILIKLGLV